MSLRAQGDLRIQGDLKVPGGQKVPGNLRLRCPRFLCDLRLQIYLWVQGDLGVLCDLRV